jgi:hypothetical protein
MRKLIITTLFWLFPVFAAGFQSTGQTPTTSPSGPGSGDQGGPRRDGSDQRGASANDGGKSDKNAASGPGSSDQGGPRRGGNQGHTDNDSSKMAQSDAAPAAGADDIQNTIQSAIQKDPGLSSANITVDVKNGKQVELNGAVPSKDAKDAAERIAKENAGGIKVKNHLKVAAAVNKSKKSDKSKGDMSNPK